MVGVKRDLDVGMIHFVQQMPQLVHGIAEVALEAVEGLGSQ